MLKKYKNIQFFNLAKEKVQVDGFLQYLESQRNFDHTIVHIDMDAFYAAVEIRENEQLGKKPMAVGTTKMLTTANYEARKFGIRSGMPGLISFILFFISFLIFFFSKINK